jgi:ATP-dependent helicase HepA
MRTSDGISRGALVCWNNGASESWGVVVAADGGHQVAAHFDDGRDLQFAWPSETLVHVLFEPGQAVELIATGDRGNIARRLDGPDRIFYSVNLADGGNRTVGEDGVRPAIELDPVVRLRNGEIDSARSVNLRLAATRLLFSHQYDDLSSLSNSRVEIKEHQVAVLHRVASTYPHRFILADEVGLGKTIEAGLIIKELKARGFADRVLVLAPSGIVSQWQYELKTKFNQVFSDYRRNTIAFLEGENPGENVWTLRDNVIASTSFAAWDENRRREIALAGWDMVVIDEAHHARRTWQGEHKYTETNLYKLAEMLADPELGRAQSFLLVTATPMQLHRFELYSLIELLDPALFPTFESFEAHTDSLAGLNATVESVRRWPTLNGSERKATFEETAAWLDKSSSSLETDLANPELRERVVEALRDKHLLSNAMIRNRKKVVGGFMPRVAALWPVELTDKERLAYDATSDYARNGYARSRATKNNALGFVMATFQKLNTSSSYALRQSLLRRIEKLEGELRPNSRDVEIEEEDLEERPVEEALDAILGAGETSDELTRLEIAELQAIVRLLDGINLDSKARVLIEKLAELAERDPNAKVIVFTQFRATQEYLRGHIGEPWTVHLFHGQLKPTEKDASVARFRASAGPQLLISTEAGGEGRNFQFCDILVNYDLPWNPMKVEQRIGRIDRIGQPKTVKIFNFSTVGTIEERVVSVLHDRIGVFQNTIGGLDPILGDVEHDLRKIFLMAESEAQKALDNLAKQIETRVRDARLVEERMGDLIMDTKSFRKDEIKELLDQHSILNTDDLRRFVICALAELDVRIEEEAEHPGIFGLRLSDRFLAAFPQFAKEEIKTRVTFEPSVALEFEEVDFLAFGHQLVDALVTRVRSQGYGGRAAVRTILTYDQGPAEGWLFVYVLEFGGIRGSKELYPVFIDLDRNERPDLAQWLLDRAAIGKREDFGTHASLLPPRDDQFETAVGLAEQRAVERLVERQSELLEANKQRLEQEREKLERFFDYRRNAETEKLFSVEQIFTRLSASEDPAVQRILPVWAKKVETARRNLASAEGDRERRLSELTLLDQVAIQHERLTACFVDVHADVTEPLRETGLDGRLLDRLRCLSRPTSAHDLHEISELVGSRADKFRALADKVGREKVDAASALSISSSLRSAAEPASSLSQDERALLRGAMAYFLIVDDVEPDLQKGGFDDDRAVADAVLRVVNGHG